MTENNERIRVLLLKYSSKTSTKVEETELFTLLRTASETDVEPLLTNILENTAPDFDAQRHERMLASVLHDAGSEIETTTKVVRLNKFWKRFAVAASIVGLLFVGYWLLRPSTTLSPANDPSTIAQDVKAPDKNRAQITLADGTTVYLDSVGNGALASQGGISVVKTADGRIEYTGHASTSLSTQYNTMSNPRGSIVMKMTLADGSKVWLNAGSSITYPVAFVGEERKVSITGEAYFEVSTKYDGSGKMKQPFIVSRGNMNVKVLGTHFNVNAYADEADMKVTLLEGSVEVTVDHANNRTNDPASSTFTPDRSSARIKPGQQATLRQAEGVGGKISVINNVDLEEVMAWKNDLFMFNSKTVTEIMRELSRWYDVEVKYESEVGNETFSAIVKRSSNVSQVLEIMKMGGVKFKVEGKTITVLK